MDAVLAFQGDIGQQGVHGLETLTAGGLLLVAGDGEGKIIFQPKTYCIVEGQWQHRVV